MFSLRFPRLPPIIEHIPYYPEVIFLTDIILGLLLCADAQLLPVRPLILGQLGLQHHIRVLIEPPLLVVPAELHYFHVV